MQEHQPQQQQRVGNQVERRISLIDFKKYAPPAFTGTSDPMEAECWLKATEKVFQDLKCPDEKNINFATFMLQGEVADWWEVEIKKLGLEDAPFT